MSQTPNPPVKCCWRTLLRLPLRALKWLAGLIFPLFLLMLVIDFGTSYLARERLYDDINQLPKNDYAVVLGTAKYYPSGSPNLYYRYRLDAAEQLIEQQKVNHLLLSGDNQTPHYNEPKMMRQDLLKRGVPENALAQDYAGYSTLESVLRAQKVFKLNSFTIVSQAFHCERALVIARFYDIDAICFAAQYPNAHYKVRIREIFARTTMVIQLLLGETGLKLAKWVKGTQDLGDE